MAVPVAAVPVPALRRLALGAVAALFALYTARNGLVIDKFQLGGWMLAAVAASSIGRSWRQVGRFVADWLPFLAILLGYDAARGIAYRLERPTLVQPQIALEKLVWFGHVPTVWFQQRFHPDATPRWFDVPLALVYLSHFVVPLGLAGWLWFRDRPAWRRMACRLVLLSLGAATIYALLPTSPPWRAADRGALPPVQLTVEGGMSLAHLDVAATAVNVGRLGLNPDAALPSLHAGFALVVSVTLWRRVRRGWRPLLVAYPLAMAFTLVVSGEHYSVDALFGWLAVALTCKATDAILARWDARSHWRPSSSAVVPALRPALEAAHGLLDVGGGAGEGEADRVPTPHRVEIDAGRRGDTALVQPATAQVHAVPPANQVADLGVQIERSVGWGEPIDAGLR